MSDVLITGAGTGIGYETALKLALSGDRVFALSRNRSRLEQLALKAKEGGGNIIPMEFDLSTDDFRTLDVVLTTGQCEHLDIVLHNAGNLITKPFEQLDREDWRSVYEVNVFGVAMLTRFLLNRMGKPSRTHIVMCGSIGGMGSTVKFPGLTAYSSSKGALAILTECLAEEFKDRGIAVNCLAMGSVQTEMLSRAFPGYKAPLGPEEMAEFVSDFCVKGWKYFNGKTIPVSISNP